MKFFLTDYIIFGNEILSILIINNLIVLEIQ